MFQAVTQVYETYKGDGDRHAGRITIACAVSALIAFCGIDLAGSALTAMSLAISVLAGFTFTALFSSYSMTTGDLPAAKDENDRFDIVRLKTLGANLRVRSAFFIAICVFDLVSIILLSIEVDYGQLIHGVAAPWVNSDFLSFAVDLSEEIRDWASVVVKFSAFVVFFECLYTFYRLTETIMAVLTTRQEYLDSHS